MSIKDSNVDTVLILLENYIAKECILMSLIGVIKINLQISEIIHRDLHANNILVPSNTSDRPDMAICKKSY
ncbi:unnamed protein product [Rhizophagus irregularis]|nr:unnamed protein product [Rhizophagus irregularis]